MRLRVSTYLLLLLILLALLVPRLSLAASQSSDDDDGDDDDLSVSDDDDELDVAAFDQPPSPPSPPQEPDVPIIPEPTPPVSDDPSIPALLSSLAQAGVDTSAVRPFDSFRGRGLQATRAIAANATVFSIPYTQIVTADYVRHESPMAGHVARLQTIDAFAVWLAAQRHNNKTRWAPYIRTLPPFVPIPLFYGPALSDEYKGTYLEEVAYDRRRSAYGVWAQMPDALKKLTSKADYMWALSILWSRSVAVAMKDEDGDWRHVAALAPLADFLNTGNASEVNVRCISSKTGAAFNCKANQAIREGEELLVSYGPRSNAVLLHDYGFALPTDNPHDFVVIDLPDPKHNKTKGDNHRVSFRKIEVRDELLRQQGKQEHDLKFRLKRPASLTHIRDVFPAELIGWARLHVMKRYEHQNLTAYDMIHKIQAGEPFSAPNTLEAVKLVHKHVRKAIRRYPNTIEEDYALLNTTDSPLAQNPALYFIVMVRYGEKAILHDVAQWITVNLPVLEADAKAEIDWRRARKEQLEREKKEKEEAERKKALEKERRRREEDAAEAARLKAIENEEAAEGTLANNGRGKLKGKGLGKGKASAGSKSSDHDELRRV